MAARLDKSLDEIISTRRTTGGRGNNKGRRVSRPGQASNAATVAPIGGIKKNLRGSKPNVKTTPTGPSSREGRVMVTGFPKDISEAMIKEYFAKTVGPIKRVELSYGPGGVSRGIANITFVRSESATKAVTECNGIPVDKRPIKVELIVDASIAKSLPAPKGLSERITSQTKATPKSAASTKTNNAAGTRGKTRGAARGARGGRNPRPAKKTAEELDSEMVDYWSAGAATTETDGGAAAPAPAATNGEDANMDDEIL